MDSPGLKAVLFIFSFSAPSGYLDAWLKVPDDDGDDIAQLYWKVRAPLTTLTWMECASITVYISMGCVYIVYITK